MGLKNFLLKKMVSARMQGVPKDEQEKMLALIQKDPALFERIAREVEEKMKSGKDQMTATMEVVRAHEEELKKLMS